ncbi:MAG: hypothetical protein A3E87_08275 [Gammaproteobacteria bacterium RIFCSPHIGHO2_12_FULL_35_23]|nr:MAG: hypothetical protein A3E87_08275 [Gammaproteobacteria bacterium RIFCSPHIGHO2_12_FULL_35_23]
MRQALELAKQAKGEGEVPVGAVLTLNDLPIATAYNQSITHQDPTAHAEIIVLREAAKILKNYRLVNTVLYVTLEPCAMCAGALIHARVKRLIYATADPRTGACGSIFNLINHQALNHQIQYESGLLAEESKLLLQQFFQKRR